MRHNNSGFKNFKRGLVFFILIAFCGSTIQAGLLWPDTCSGMKSSFYASQLEAMTWNTTPTAEVVGIQATCGGDADCVRDANLINDSLGIALHSVIKAGQDMETMTKNYDKARRLARKYNLGRVNVPDIPVPEVASLMRYVLVGQTSGISAKLEGDKALAEITSALAVTKKSARFGVLVYQFTAGEAIYIKFRRDLRALGLCQMGTLAEIGLLPMVRVKLIAALRRLWKLPMRGTLPKTAFLPTLSLLHISSDSRSLLNARNQGLRIPLSTFQLVAQSDPSDIIVAQYVLGAIYDSSGPFYEINFDDSALAPACAAYDPNGVVVDPSNPTTATIQCGPLQAGIFPPEVTVEGVKVYACDSFLPIKTALGQTPVELVDGTDQPSCNILYDEYEGAANGPSIVYLKSQNKVIVSFAHNSLQLMDQNKQRYGKVTFLASLGELGQIHDMRLGGNAEVQTVGNCPVTLCPIVPPYLAGTLVARYYWLMATNFSDDTRNIGLPFKIYATGRALNPKCWNWNEAQYAYFPITDDDTDCPQFYGGIGEGGGSGNGQPPGGSGSPPGGGMRP